MFKYLNPLYFIKVIKCIFKNISMRKEFNNVLYNIVNDEAFKYIKTEIKSNVLFFGINLKPEIKLVRSTDFDLDVEEKKQLAVQISRFNDVFLKYGIIEMIKIHPEKIDDENFYGFIVNVSYRPICKISDYVFVTIYAIFAAFLGFATYMNFNILIDYLKSF